MTDTIADYLTRVRNAVLANHRLVEIPASNLKKEITKILKDKGYILDFKFEDDNKQGTIKIALKYHPVTKVPAIRNIHGLTAATSTAGAANGIGPGDHWRLRKVSSVMQACSSGKYAPRHA